ncbi:flowering-promoting factor 1 [Arabidopsis lyrata subsp. lyrata]|nr:flowering-promoting factor 1 [Arabidopsis lyrata subsp. lyrata]|eukprot:XP_020878608.1 flowering-promoting factor 1 [Arabidopsis lyrata subsp. lyrata]
MWSDPLLYNISSTHKSLLKNTKSFHIYSLYLSQQNKTKERKKKIMSGVWVFKNGVIRLVENPNQSGSDTHSRRKVMVYLPTGEVVSSYSTLEQILQSLGWERYFGGDTDLLQFHKRSSIDLISLPRDFTKFNSVYMYDIVVKNPNYFHVRDSH